MKKAFKFNIFTFAVLYTAKLRNVVFLSTFFLTGAVAPFDCGVSPLCVFAVKNVSAQEDPYVKFGVVKSKRIKTAPNFTLKDLSGKEISLEDYKGKVILLHFWATWCEPCIKEMPTMERFYNIFKDKGLDVLAVSIDRGNRKEVESFVNRVGMTFPVLLDQDQKVRKKYFIEGLPTSYLISRDGKMKGFISGAREWDSDDAIKFMDAILQENW